MSPRRKWSLFLRRLPFLCKRVFLVAMKNRGTLRRALATTAALAVAVCSLPRVVEGRPLFSSSPSDALAFVLSSIGRAESPTPSFPRASSWRAASALPKRRLSRGLRSEEWTLTDAAKLFAERPSQPRLDEAAAVEAGEDGGLLGAGSARGALQRRRENVSPVVAQMLYEDMLLGRYVEDACAQLYYRGKTAGFVHLYTGQEAVSTGVLKLLRKDDAAVSTYRDHVHATSKGIPVKEVFAELFGKKTGCSKGFGGSMHMFSKEWNLYGGFAFIGEQIPVALGVAFSQMYRRLATTELPGEKDQVRSAISAFKALLPRLPRLCRRSLKCSLAVASAGDGVLHGRRNHKHRAVLRSAQYGFSAQAARHLRRGEQQLVGASRKKACANVRTAEAPRLALSFLSLLSLRRAGQLEWLLSEARPSPTFTRGALPLACRASKSTE